jgi:hypothetical protein
VAGAPTHCEVLATVGQDDIVLLFEHFDRSRQLSGARPLVMAEGLTVRSHQQSLARGECSNSINQGCGQPGPIAQHFAEGNAARQQTVKPKHREPQITLFP